MEIEKGDLGKRTGTFFLERIKTASLLSTLPTRLYIPSLMTFFSF